MAGCLVAALGRSGRDRVQHFALAAAVFVNAVGVAIEHLQHRQRLPLDRQLARHVVGRRQGHHRVEADIVLAAERAGIGQRRRGHQRLELGAAIEAFDQRRQQPLDGGLLQ